MWNPATPRERASGADRWRATATDEIEASGGARSAIASLLHPWKGSNAGVAIELDSTQRPGACNKVLHIIKRRRLRPPPAQTA